MEYSFTNTLKINVESKSFDMEGRFMCGNTQLWQIRYEGLYFATLDKISFFWGNPTKCRFSFLG